MSRSETLGSDCLCVFLLRKKRIPKTSAIRAIALTATPTPMPAFAPLLSPLLEPVAAVLVAGVDAVATAAVVVVCIEEVGVVADEDVAVALNVIAVAAVVGTT